LREAPHLSPPALADARTAQMSPDRPTADAATQHNANLGFQLQKRSRRAFRTHGQWMAAGLASAVGMRSTKLWIGRGMTTRARLLGSIISLPASPCQSSYVFGGTSVMKSNLNCANAVSRPSLGASARDSDRCCVTQPPATRDSGSTVRQTGHVDAALLAAHESNQRPRHREWNLFRWVDQWLVDPS
jgi:hypothetical protein